MCACVVFTLCEESRAENERGSEGERERERGAGGGVRVLSQYSHSVHTCRGREGRE